MAVDPTGPTLLAAAVPPRLEPGAIIAERYRIEALLGEGGMGLVYRVDHVHMRKRFALKVLGAQWAGTPEALARFEREAIAAANIEHPNVAHATDFGRLPDGSCFLVLEYIDGRTLREALKRGALDPARALRVARGITSAVAAAHAKGVIHRDLKPENVMLVEHEGDPDFVKVLDFGIAKLDGPMSTRDGVSGLTKQGAIMGTPAYMSPEQAIGERVDERTDLYAIGVMLFEMLAGECPFKGEAVSVLRRHVLEEAPSLPPPILKEVDARVAGVCRRLLAKSPEERFASAVVLLAAVEECLRPAVRDAPAPAPAPAPAGRTPTFALGRASPADEGAVSRAARTALSWPSGVVEGFRARRRRQRLRAAIAWPGALIDRYRGWQRKRRLRKALTSARQWLARARQWLTPRRLGLVAGVFVALIVTLVAVLTRAGADRPNVAPAASSTAARTAGAKPKAKPRRTGPGGIYVPPPREWFR